MLLLSCLSTLCCQPYLLYQHGGFATRRQVWHHNLLLQLPSVSKQCLEVRYSTLLLPCRSSLMVSNVKYAAHLGSLKRLHAIASLLLFSTVSFLPWMQQSLCIIRRSKSWTVILQAADHSWQNLAFVERDKGMAAA
jgi:hypothetical protein